MTFSLRNALITIVILGIEILIAFFVHDRIIRPFFGDFLAVILIYYLARTFLKISSIKIAIGVLLFSVMIEFLQYFNFLEFIGMSDYLMLRIVLGSTFDWFDIIAYFLGAVAAYFLDIKPEKYFQK